MANRIYQHCPYCRAKYLDQRLLDWHIKGIHSGGWTEKKVAIASIEPPRPTAIEISKLRVGDYVRSRDIWQPGLQMSQGATRFYPVVRIFAKLPRNAFGVMTSTKAEKVIRGGSIIQIVKRAETDRQMRRIMPNPARGEKTVITYYHCPKCHKILYKSPGFLLCLVHGYVKEKDAIKRNVTVLYNPIGKGNKKPVKYGTFFNSPQTGYNRCDLCGKGAWLHQMKINGEVIKVCKACGYDRGQATIPDKKIRRRKQ
jgi:hypothetical protein